MDINILAFFQDLKRLHDSIFEDFYKQFELTRLQTIFLMYLDSNPQCTTANEFIAVHNVTKSHVSQSIDFLAKRGFIKCLPDKMDKRKINIKICDSAMPIIAASHAREDDFVNKLMTDFNKNDEQMLDLILSKISNNAKSCLQHNADH